jgi:general secretion pathway protein N
MRQRLQRLAAPPTPRTWRWAWAGVAAGAALALLTQAPARWLSTGMNQAFAQRLQLRNPQGTVWNGSAQWVLSSGVAADEGAALPTRLQWHIAPQFDLSQGRVLLSIVLHSDCCTPTSVRVDLTPRWRGMDVHVHDQPSNWPAQWLVGLGAPWNTIHPEGRLQLNTRGLIWRWQAGRERLEGQAEVRIDHLSTRLSTLRPLGSYRLTVRGDDTIGITLDTLEGSLRLVGQGQWSEQHLQFHGEASAEPDSENALSNLLNVLGQRQGAKSILKIGT